MYIHQFIFSSFFLSFIVWQNHANGDTDFSVCKKHGPNRRFAASILLKIRNIVGHSESPMHIFSLCPFPLRQTFGQNRPYAQFIQSAKVPCNKIVRRYPFEQCCYWLYFNEGCRTIRNFLPKTVASDFRYLRYVEI